MQDGRVTRPFNTRRFVAFVTGLAALILPVTGTATHVHLAPTLGRHAWMAAHNSAGSVFVLFLVWHLVLNRRALVNHVRAIGAAREAFWALLIVIVTTAAAAGHAFLAH